MPEITLEDYKRVDRQLERTGQARLHHPRHRLCGRHDRADHPQRHRGRRVPVGRPSDGLVGGRPDPALPVWGALVDKTISGRQARIEQRAAAGKRAA